MWFVFFRVKVSSKFVAPITVCGSFALFLFFLDRNRKWLLVNAVIVLSPLATESSYWKKLASRDRLLLKTGPKSSNNLNAEPSRNHGTKYCCG